MKKLEWYIAKIVLSCVALVTLMLAGLQVFILFVNQLDDLGKNDFGIIQASIYVLFQMPYQVYLFFPMASLLGCLIGLSILANHRELIVMRSAGMSIQQITAAVLKAAFLLIIMVTLLGETLVPKLSQYANNARMQALSKGQALRTAQGVWLRQQNDFIAISQVQGQETLKGVYQFRFDNTHHLAMARKIDTVRFIDGKWIAYHSEETHFTSHKIWVEQHEIRTWDIQIKPVLLSLNIHEIEEMTLKELHQYLHAQKINHQSALAYQLAYWQRIIQPLTTVVMMILAIPFVFGPLRSSTMGAKLLAGATAGFSFYIINRFFGPVSQVMQWPPLIAAIAPTCLFAIVGIYLMRRVK